MPSTKPSAATHATLFYAIRGARLEDGQIIRPAELHLDMVEVPACGFRTVTWAAEHPERGWENGVILLSRDEPDPNNTVAEVLWGRGYIGTYRVVVIP